MWIPVATYLIAINLAAFAAFGLDKRQAARNGWRISEMSLLRLAAVGGSPGAFAGSQVFRHKTRKEPFVTRLRLVALTQAVLLGLFAIPEVRRRVLDLTLGLAGASA